MIEEILPDLYRIEVPLPRSPLKYLNAYLIKAKGRFLLIDTGQNREECKRTLLSALEKLAVDLEKTDFFITHLHSDHLGLVSSLATEASKVYFTEKESYIENVTSPARVKHWQLVSTIYRLSGFPEDEARRAIENHPGRRYGLKKDIKFSFKKEDDTIEIGDYLFRCIETPGHSPGHMCLYEANKKILVAGDHILFDITPNITHWPEMADSLKTYLESLEKVFALDVDLVLPGHRRLLKDHRKRIRELQEHHQARADEVLSVLEDGEKTAYQVAQYVTWDIDCNSWAEFPAAQKWFAVGETIAHLEYLEGEGKVRRKTGADRIRFSLS